MIRLRGENADLRRTISNAIHTYLNPHMPPSEKTAFFAALALIEQKRDSGQVRADGSVEITSAEVSDDWRKAPEAGESVSPTNTNGVKPRMSRDKVKPAIKALVDRGFVNATPRKVKRTRANGTTYLDEVWDFTPPANMADALARAATWKPAEIKQRKPRTHPVCLDCGTDATVIEVTTTTREYACGECGQQLGEPTTTTTRRTLPATETSSEATADQPTPTPSPYVRKNSGHSTPTPPVARGDVRKNSGHRAVPEEPDHLRHAPPVEYDPYAYLGDPPPP